MSNNIMMKDGGTNPFLQELCKVSSDILNEPVHLHDDRGVSSSMRKATRLLAHIASESDINWDQFMDLVNDSVKHEITYALNNPSTSSPNKTL